MNFVLRTLVGVVFAAMAWSAWADQAEPAPAEPAPAEEPAPAPEPEPAPVEEAPAEEPAAEEETGRRFYAGAGLALVEFDVDTASGSNSASVTAGQLRAGYFVLPWLAVEGMLITGFNEAELDKSTTPETEIDLDVSYGIYVKPHHNFGPLDMFATLGFADINTDVSGPAGTADAEDSGLSYGFGIRIPTSAGAFDLEYLKLLDESDVDVDSLVFSYNRFFW